MSKSRKSREPYLILKDEWGQDLAIYKCFRCGNPTVGIGLDHICVTCFYENKGDKAPMPKDLCDLTSRKEGFRLIKGFNLLRLCGDFS